MELHSKIYILDPCFGDMTGHWENYCRRLYQEFIEKKYTPQIFGRYVTVDKIIEGTNHIPLFQQQPFIHMADETQFQKQVDLYRSDLDKIEYKQLQNEVIFFAHSIYPQIFSAMIHWLSNITQYKNIKLCILFQFTASPPRLKSKWENLREKLFGKNSKKIDWIHNQDTERYQSVSTKMERLIKNKNLILLANTEDLSTNFSKLLKTTVFPIPMPGEKILPTNDLKEKKIMTKKLPEITIGYFGHSSLEKGGQYIQSIVEKTIKIFPYAKFILHLNPNQETEQFFNFFKNYHHPNVECHHGHLSTQMIMELISATDIILMPYSQLKYATLPSAIFTESMPLNKIFILPKNTWIHREARKYKAGFVGFSKYNEKSILYALLKAILDFKKLHLASLSAGNIFHAKNNMDNYMKEMFSHIKNAWNITL